MGSSPYVFNGQLLILILVLCSLLSNGLAKDADEVVVKVSKGKVRGTVGTSIYSQKSFYQFKAIPYAKPPIGPLRWRAPEEAESWEGILDATKYSAICPQLSESSNEIVEGDESCLFANVFTPSIKTQEEKYPVVILIHGGSFQYESGSAYSPEYLMEKPIVLVTFNYRLGVLGFLSTGSKVIQGNAGLKDQVLLMKWVRDNIDSFNGNPNKVTLMGLSSGSASVHLHMVSPMSQGLFHQAISQSGTAFCPWAMMQKPENKIKKLSGLVNCTENSKSIEDVKECLLKIDAKTLVLQQSAFAEWYIDPIVPVGPVIEKEGLDPVFLPDSPYRLIQKGEFQKNIPWLLGVNSQEGLLHSADIVNNGMLLRVINLEWKQAAPITLLYKHTTLSPNTTSEAILDYYFNGGMINDTNFDSLTNMYSDRYFFHGTHHAAKAHIKNGATAPIYLYYFDYVGDFSFVHLNERNSAIKGVAHYDQVQYLFKLEGFPEITESQHEFSKKFINTLFNFIESGKPGNGPSDEWRAVELQDTEENGSFKYNVIGSTNEIIDEPFKDRMLFWDQLVLLELDKEIDGTYLSNYTNNHTTKDEL